MLSCLSRFSKSSGAISSSFISKESSKTLRLAGSVDFEDSFSIDMLRFGEENMYELLLRIQQECDYVVYVW